MRSGSFPAGFGIFLSLFLLTIAACGSDDDGGSGDRRITSVVLTFTNPDGQTAVYQADDPDGTGTGAATVDEVSIRPNTDYVLKVFLLDESGPETRIITEEVLAEPEKHLLCFEATGPLLPPAAQDADANGAPLGLTSLLTTTEAGTGTLRILLRRDPDKGAAAACETGRVEVDQTFAVRVE